MKRRVLNLSAFRSTAAGFLCLALTSAVVGKGHESLTFEHDIRPLLKAHCFHCHGETDKPKADVDLRLRRFLLKKAEDGPVLVPGKPGASLMVKLMRSGEMPKGEKKVPEEEIARIERWIAAGAKTARAEPAELPRGFYLTEEDRAYWAFQPVHRPPVPPEPRRVERARIRNPIDAFLGSRLREEKLSFAPEAGRRELIRRLYFDLIGLPPSPEAVEAFLVDPAPEAYEKLVERLLDSPSYSERWARHWLDAAGYADSNGFTESDSVRAHAWRYRDYVIRSIAADKPWNQFIVEQLAGDELAGVTHQNAVAKAADPRVQELLAATGYLRMAPDGTDDGPPDPNLARNQVLAETLKIVSSSLLGLTVGCAQCHDHRYDPISHVDYHRVRAIFEPAYDWKNWRGPGARQVSLYTEADRKKAGEIEAQAKSIGDEAERMRKEFLEKVFEREIAKVPEADRAAVKLARNTAQDKRSPEQKLLLKKHPAADVQGALDLYDPEANKKVTAKHAEAAKVRGTKPVEPFLMALTEVAGTVPETRLFNRGDHDQPRQVVAPGELEVLMAAAGTAAGRSDPFAAGSTNRPTGASSARRLTYARWLTNGQHPLVARVLVNRFWSHHFGRGLVNTPGDFGRLGERPTHSELLDWLASEFVEPQWAVPGLETGLGTANVSKGPAFGAAASRGCATPLRPWSLKHLHRLMVTSVAYRQSTRNDASLRADPDNRLYARMKLRRLDAETLRDSILAVSGKLNPAPFGPPIATARDLAGRVVTGAQKTDANGDPVGIDAMGEQEFRRSLYIQMRRTQPLTVLDTFDLPVMAPNCDARPVTTVAPQSLLLMNDVFVVTLSQHMAERLRREHLGDLRAQIVRAWHLLFSDAPSQRELADSLTYLAEQSETVRARDAALEAMKKEKDKDKAAPMADVSLQTLASLCQVLMSGNRFLYVE